LLNAYATLPFATSVSEKASDSDIRGNLDRSRQVLNVYRRAWFKNADFPALSEELRRLSADAKVTPMTDCYIQAARFVLSDQWVGF
jgi:hypothetical protein